MLSIIGGLAVMAFPTLIADIFWLPARMIVPSIGVFAVLHWMSLYNRTDACKSLIVVAMLGTMFLVAQFFGIQAQEVDCIKTIAVEENEIKTIARFIENYEHNSGNTINKVAFIHDMAPTYKYYNIISNDRYYGEMQTRSILWIGQIYNYLIFILEEVLSKLFRMQRYRASLIMKTLICLIQDNKLDLLMT